MALDFVDLKAFCAATMLGSFGLGGVGSKVGGTLPLPLRHDPAEAEGLEQRIGLLEVCKTMSSLDNLADLSEKDISTYVYRIQQRERTLAAHPTAYDNTRRRNTPAANCQTRMQLLESEAEESAKAARDAKACRENSKKMKVAKIAR